METHTITASTGSNGSIDTSGSVAVDHGADMTFIIRSDAGYAVASVVVNGSPVGALSSYSFTSYSFTNVTVNHTISGSFSTDCSNGRDGKGGD